MGQPIENLRIEYDNVACAHKGNFTNNVAVNTFIANWELHRYAFSNSKKARS